MIKWLKIKEAEEYYQVNRQLIHKWRREGTIDSKVDTSTKRFGYIYEKNEALREKVLERKQVDARYKF